jgi:hypothetical protein
MAASPIDVGGNWLQNLLDPEVVNLGMMFSRWENQAFNVTTMFASDENVAVQTEASAEPFRV